MIKRVYIDTSVIGGQFDKELIEIRTPKEIINYDNTNV
jgi:hypothetical protein